MLGTALEMLPAEQQLLELTRQIEYLQQKLRGLEAVTATGK